MNAKKTIHAKIMEPVSITTGRTFVSAQKVGRDMTVK